MKKSRGKKCRIFGSLIEVLTVMMSITTCLAFIFAMEKTRRIDTNANSISKTSLHAPGVKSETKPTKSEEKETLNSKVVASNGMETNTPALKNETKGH